MLMLSGGLLVLVASSPQKNIPTASSSSHPTVEETVVHILVRNNAYSWDQLQDVLQQQRKLGTTGGVPGDGLLLAVANSDGSDAEASDFLLAIAESDYPDGFDSQFDPRHKDLLPLDRYCTVPYI